MTTKGHGDAKRTSGVAALPHASRNRSRPASRSTVALTYGGLLLAALAAFVSHEWDATSHSLIALTVLGVVTWHVLSQRRWIRSIARRRSAHPDRVLALYNAALATTFTVANLSGFPVWFLGSPGLILRLHQITGVLFVVMAIGHLIWNRRRLFARLRARRPL